MSSIEQGVRHAFHEHQEEIRRRSDASVSADLNPKTFRRVEADGVDDPYQNPEQKFIVFSLSHREFAPVPVNPSEPALCVYGAFETAIEAHTHARIVQNAHPEVSVLIDETHKWILAPATIARLSDAAYVEEKTRIALARVEEVATQNTREFFENVENQRMGRIESHSAADETDPLTTKDNPRGSKINIASSCRIDDQKLCVLSVLRDDGADCEFLFRVYCCVDSEESSNRYVRNTCGNHVQDFDIDVVQTCKWAYPQSMRGNKVQREVYRSDELNRVMQVHKQNPQQVENFYKEHGTPQEYEKTQPLHAASSSNEAEAFPSPAEPGWQIVDNTAAAENGTVV